MLSNQPFHFQALTRKDHAFLLLHGLGGGVYEMSLLGKYLHEKDFTVVGINYPGHDIPARRMPASTWQQWYQRVEEAYLELKQTHAEVTVIGFSTGCMLALHLAAHHPLCNLVLLSPFLKIKHEWFYLLRPERYIRLFGGIIRQVPRSPLSMKDKSMLPHARNAAYFRTFNMSAVKSALELIRMVDDELDRIMVPTLIIQSHRDSIVCPSGAKYLMQRMKCPRKEVHWLHESDHVICLDLERDEVMRKISEFLSLDGSALNGVEANRAS